jgi:hypothetical protein
MAVNTPLGYRKKKGNPQSKLHEPLPVLVLQVFGVPFGPPKVLNTKSFGLPANMVSASPITKLVVLVCPLFAPSLIPERFFLVVCRSCEHNCKSLLLLARGHHD